MRLHGPWKVPTDFTLISLSSFMPKTLERILVETIRKKLKKNQHAYIKGRSQESSLHSAHHIEKPLSV